MRLGEILLKAGRITPEQLQDALDDQKNGTTWRRLGDILCASRIISDIQLVEALAEQCNASWTADIDGVDIDPSLVTDLSVDWARQHSVLPVRWNGQLAALMSDPTRVEVLHDLSLLIGAEVVPLVTTVDSVKKAIERAFYQKRTSQEQLIGSIGKESRGVAPTRSEDILRGTDEAPVTHLINLILLDALRERASDIHIEPFAESLRIRFRIDGMLYERPSPPKNLEAALVSRIKIMARLDIAEKRLPQDGMAGVRVGEREIDIRVSTVPVAEGERVVLRLLNRSSTLMPLSDLGMPAGLLAQLRDLLHQPHGILLVTGPTGSGKTTTLYAALQELDKEHSNILTIEDPIEYQLPRIGQIQVKPKIGLTFAQGLRHVLRQDPDVILVGEIRDAETAEIAVRASLTGHLVLSTLHTNDATAAVVRLIDMGIEPYLLSSALRGVLGQRLVRKLCPACRKREDKNGKTVWKAVGCPECVAGYRERTGVYELCVVTPDLQEAIRLNRSPRELEEIAVRSGMRRMIDDAVAKAGEGVTSMEEINRVIGNAS